jgi:hypothetical protein
VHLIDDWKYLSTRLWSVRLSLIAAALGGVEVALPMFSDALPRGLFAGLSVGVAVAAAAARLVAQPKLDADTPGTP